MLRNAILVIALLVAGGGAIALATGHPEAMPAAIWGGILTVAVLFERWRYQPPPATGGNWQPTGEQFIDPESGAAMEVLYDPGTGERRYVAKAGKP
ncbi:hypothetical protein HUX88_10920 [Duganella sp. BJB1802]|uniref:hypothetical protein n=1 Tax=Duganella sp. BJB1802 TaxID=2744575 RepID=UPI001594DAC5|nr:hypothetical protein [Duganella sp. BJB1802]NVD71067.1 hypothetical protein [Duganella sp. BJB1802]